MNKRKIISKLPKYHTNERIIFINMIWINKIYTLKMLKRTSYTWKKSYSSSLESVITVFPRAGLQGARENMPRSQNSYLLSTLNYFISPLLQLSYLSNLPYSKFLTQLYWIKNWDLDKLLYQHLTHSIMEHYSTVWVLRTVPTCSIPPPHAQ